MLSDDPAALARYSELTGTEPDPAALALYGLRWTLADLAEFLASFRGPHRYDSDTETAWRGVRRSARSQLGEQGAVNEERVLTGRGGCGETPRPNPH